MSFNSKNFNPNAGSNIPKIMNPGTNYCRIVDMKLDTPPYNKESYFVVLTLEGMDMGDDFQGIAKDKNNPAAGVYRGQIANVRSGRYPFSTYSFQGREIKRDDQIFRWVNNLAKQLNILDKMNADNVQAETIEEYVDAVKKYVTNPDVWAHHTIGGQEYFTEGYDKPNYRLFYPKTEGKLLPFSSLEDETGAPLNLIPFDRSKHIIVKSDETTEKVEDFGGQGAIDMLNIPSAEAGVPDIKLPF